MPATLAASGLSIQTLAAIQAELAASVRAGLGQQAGADEATTALGILVGILADLESLTQEAIQAVYLAFTLDGAAGVSLDRLVALGGLTRKVATQSTVTLRTVNPTGAPITIPSGALVEITATGDRFVYAAAVVVGAGATVNTSIKAVATGAIPTGASATWAWVSSFAGSTSLTLSNPTAGTVGALAESDADLRIRFVASYHTPGAGTLDAILAAVLAVSTVKAAAAFENVEMVAGITSPETIADLPAKSFVVVERDGVDADVAAAIWRKKPAGIKAHGNTTVNVADSQGYTHTIGVESATSQRVYVDVAITGPASLSTVGAAVRAAIVAYGAGLSISADVLVQRVLCAALDAAPTATNIVVKLDTVSPPALTTNLAIAWNKYAGIASGDVTGTINGGAF